MQGRQGYCASDCAILLAGAAELLAGGPTCPAGAHLAAAEARKAPQVGQGNAGGRGLSPVIVLLRQVSQASSKQTEAHNKHTLNTQ